jgi:hypothetical protein
MNLRRLIEEARVLGGYKRKKVTAALAEYI